jgi:F-type H+-transporting ATPase subunit delta
VSKMILAQRYADALGGTIENDEELNVALEEITAFSEAFHTNAELRSALLNPSIPQDTRVKIFNEILESKTAPTPAKRVIEILFERGRLEILGEIVTAFRETMDERLHRIGGTIFSIRVLTDEQRDSIQRHVSRYMGRDVQLDTEIDPDILGGVVVRIGSIVLDGSLRARLAKLKKTLLAEENGQYENSGH